MQKKNEESWNAQLADNVRFSGIIESGFCWDEQARERMRDPKSLEPYGYKVYSQNDEDGIIHEIFKRIGFTSKTFIEFGVQNGLESNCHLLLLYGWKGLWIEESLEYCKEISIKFRPVIKNGQLKVINAFITKDNINGFFQEAGFVGEIDLLSIDIDGNDFYVWDAIEVINPRVVIVEYNGKFPPDLEWKQAYNSTHIWNGTDWYGASLKLFELLGKNKGYQLVGTNLRGCNAFFVRNDLAKDWFYEPATAEALYNPLRMELQFVANHPSQYCLAEQRDNIGILNYELYELIEGFHEEEIANGAKYVWTSATKSMLNLIVAAGTKSVEIPYSLPVEVFGENKEYEITMYTKDCEKLSKRIKQPIETWTITIDQVLSEDCVLEVYIESSYVWQPCELLGNGDSRYLGINILLSEIKMISA